MQPQISFHPFVGKQTKFPDCIDNKKSMIQLVFNMFKFALYDYQRACPICHVTKCRHRLIGYAEAQSDYQWFCIRYGHHMDPP